MYGCLDNSNGSMQYAQLQLEVCKYLYLYLYF